MLAYGKNFSRNNQFFGFFCPEKNILPRKKSAQIFEKFTKKIKICPVTESSLWSNPDSVLRNYKYFEQ